MAIDTAAKRFSLMHLAMPWRGPAVVPTGTVDQAERQTFLNYYSGILWEGAVDNRPSAIVRTDVMPSMRRVMPTSRTNIMPATRKVGFR